MVKGGVDGGVRRGARGMRPMGRVWMVDVGGTRAAARRADLEGEC